MGVIFQFLFVGTLVINPAHAADGACDVSLNGIFDDTATRYWPQFPSTFVILAVGGPSAPEGTTLRAHAELAPGGDLNCSPIAGAIECGRPSEWLGRPAPRGQYTVSGTCELLSGEGAIVESRTKTFRIFIDVAPPTVQFNGVNPIYEPQDTIQISGNISDESPIDTVYLRLNSYAQPILPSSFDGSAFTFQIPISTYASGFSEIQAWVQAQDRAGRSTSSEPQTWSKTDYMGLPLSSGSWTFPATSILSIPVDIASPTLAINDISPVNFTVISGTAEDDYRVDKLFIEIRNIWSSLYWNPASSKFDLPTPPEIRLAFDSTAGEGPWSYTGITAKHFSAGRAYAVKVRGVDVFGREAVANKLIFPIPNVIAAIDKALLGLGGGGHLEKPTVDPSNLSVGWGGRDFRNLCIKVFPANSTLSSSERFELKEKLEARNYDGTLTVLSHVLDGGCGAAEFAVRILSNPMSCARQGQLQIEYSGTIIGSFPIKIVAPSLSTARLIFPNAGAGLDMTSDQECKNAGTTSPCRVDLWEITLIANDGAIDYMPLEFFENQRRLRPLNQNTRLCPGGITVQSRPRAFERPGQFFDGMGFYGTSLQSRRDFKNCGHASTQGLLLVSDANGASHGCEFIFGIEKTSYLDSERNIHTTRSDSVP